MRKGETWDAVTTLAESQWGLVTTAQAARVDVGRVTMNRLASRGYLEHEAYGVYRVRGTAAALATPRQVAWLQLDPALFLEERWNQLYTGGVVSHRAAARAQDLGDVLGEIHEFTVPTRRRTRRGDVVLHRGELARDDVRLLDGLPVTTPWRTVVDLVADGEDGGHVAGVLRDAVRSGQLLLDQLDAGAGALDRYAPTWVIGMSDGVELLAHLCDLAGLSPTVPASR